MVPERQDYLIMLINKHDPTAGCYVRISFRFLLTYEARRRRNTLPSLAAAPEKLHRRSLTSSRSASYNTKTSCQALFIGPCLRNSGGEALRV